MRPATTDFRYVAWNSGIVQFLPVIDLRIRFRTRQIGALGLVDSGSTRTYMPSGIAGALGLTARGGGLAPSESESLSGKFDTYQARISRMDIFRNTVLVGTFVNPVVNIVRSSTAIDFVVLGRDYVFNRYKVTFSERRKKITLGSA